MCSLEANATAQADPKRTHYRGVRKRSEDRFAAEIRDPSKRRRVWLGTFSSDIEAAHAYDQAARAIKGCNAKTNFPLSAYQHPTPVTRSAAYQNPEPVPIREKLKELAQQRHVPSWINSNMFAKAASRPWTHAFLNRSFNVGTSWSSFLEVLFPPELQRQQQLAALKMSNRPRCNENEGDGGVGEIHEGHKESCSPCNSSDPPSSGVTESTDSPKTVLDLNFPPPVEGDECGHLHSDENSIKTLWLLK